MTLLLLFQSNATPVLSGSITFTGALSPTTPPVFGLITFSTTVLIHPPVTAAITFTTSLTAHVGINPQLSGQIRFRNSLYASMPTPPVQAGVPTYRVENSLVRQTGVAVWFDVMTDRLFSATIERGRPDELSGTQAGTMTLVFDNDDGALDTPGGILGGWFDGAYSIRVVATYDGDDYILGTGYVDEVTHQRAGALGDICTVRTVDLFKELGQARPVNYSQAGLGPIAFPAGQMSDRLNDLLDSVSIAMVGERDFSSGTYPLRADQPQDTPFLQLVDWMCKLEHGLGVFFERGDGTLVFLDSLHRQLEWAKGTFGIGDGVIPLKDYTTRHAFAGIYNEVHVFRPTYSDKDQVASDGNSILQYGRGVYTLDPKAADNIASDAEALQWAKDFLTTYKKPRYRVDSITLDPFCGEMEMQAWGHVLTREIGDRIRLNVPLSGSSGVIYEDYHIEGLRHEINFNGLEHTVTYRVSRRAGTVGFL